MAVGEVVEVAEDGTTVDEGVPGGLDVGVRVEEVGDAVSLDKLVPD